MKFILETFFCASFPDDIRNNPIEKLQTDTYHIGNKLSDPLDNYKLYAAKSQKISCEDFMNETNIRFYHTKDIALSNYNYMHGDIVLLNILPGTTFYLAGKFIASQIKHATCKVIDNTSLQSDTMEDR